MIDFTVPLSPGWGRRVREKQWDEDGDVLAISPTMLHAIYSLAASLADGSVSESHVQDVEESARVGLSDPEDTRRRELVAGSSRL